MRIIFATDLSDANETAMRSRTCIECLARIGVTAVHLVTVVPDNVSSGLPGMESPRTVTRRSVPSVSSSNRRGSPSRRTSPAARRTAGSTGSPSDSTPT